jgi:hypothetical protein
LSSSRNGLFRDGRGNSLDFLLSPVISPEEGAVGLGSSVFSLSNYQAPPMVSTANIFLERLGESMLGDMGYVPTIVEGKDIVKRPFRVKISDIGKQLVSYACSNQPVQSSWEYVVSFLTDWVKNMEVSVYVYVITYEK